MRRSFLVVAAALSVITAACGGSTAQDPYETARRAVETPWHQVQIDVGASVKSGSTTVTLDPGTVRLVIDGTAGKGLFHLSLPTTVLGADASSLAQLGITGSTLDFDAVYDGQAFYARSPVLKTVVELLLAGSADAPTGDLTGWLRLATRSDLEALVAGSSAAPSPSASLDAATIKKTLNDNGLTLTFVATEKRDGADQDHVSVAVDVDKLLDSPVFDSANRGQLNQLREAAKNGTVTADLWTDLASGRLAEIDLHVAATGTNAGSATATVTFAPPAPGTSFDAPAGAVDVPARVLLGEALKMLGQSIGQ